MEKDFLKETENSKNNFPLNIALPHKDLISSIFQVKLAATKTNIALGFIDKESGGKIESIIERGIEGEFNKHFCITMLQGGAGTSLNMIANEVIAYHCYKIYGIKLSPYDTINLHQSTNDVIPTSVKITVLKLVRKLEKSIIELLKTLEEKETEFDSLVKPGLTQMQYAVPVTLGREFSAYSSAISRDRWRISKIVERIKEVNIGGTAIGTGFKAPRMYIFRVIEELRKITDLPLTRAENLIDSTQNLDSIVEVSGILTTLATNLIKISNDLRFLSSSPVNQIELKEVQTGSSIMPGKVNPVIPEFAISCGVKAQSNHCGIQYASSMGNLELNPFLPLIAHLVFESIEVLDAGCFKLSQCIKTLQANRERFENLKYLDSTVLYALSTIIGYEKAKDVFNEAKGKGGKLYDFIIENKIASKEELENALTPENLLKLGF